MQHVDEGQLHEYLDRADARDEPELLAVAAHIASCESCSRRMREAELLRSEAQTILHVAAPAPRARPSFAEIAARASAAGGSGAAAPVAVAPASGRGRRSDYTRLAWAATVVLALGAGWIGHALYRSGALDERVATVPASAPDNAELEAAASSEAASAPSAGAAGAATTAQGADMQARGTRVQPPAGAGAAMRGESDAGAAAEREMVAAAPATLGDAAARKAAAATQGAAPSAEIQVQGDRDPLVPRNALSSRSIVVAGAPPAAPAPAPPPQAARPGSGAGSVREHLGLRAADTAGRALEAAPAAEGVSAFSGRVAPAWRMVDAGEASRAAGGWLVMADGLDVLDMSVAAAGDGDARGAAPVRIRVRQLTSAGDTITIEQGAAPAGATADVVVSARGARNAGSYVTLSHRGRPVTVTARRVSILDTVLPLLSAGPAQ